MSDRLLSEASHVGKLGDRSMVRLDPRVVKLYRVEWEYDGQWAADFDYETGAPAEPEPVRRVRVKHFRNRGAAYKWMALRLIFAKRDKLPTGIGSNGYPSGCRLCDALPRRGPEDQPMCRYHDHGGDEFERLRTRLARWLRWRDSRIEATNA